MWSRVVEIMLGVWLMISPFIFSHPDSQTSWWINDLTTGTAIVIFGLFAFWSKTRYAHLLTLVTACWLMFFAYLKGFGDPPAAMQNNLVTGICLLMFSVIPNEASQPPKSWDEKRESSC